MGSFAASCFCIDGGYILLPVLIAKISPAEGIEEKKGYQER